MKFTGIDADAITSVLLTDGWHQVALGASFEFLNASVTEPDPDWFRFTERLPATTQRAGEQTTITGPLSSIVALRLKEKLPGH
ncbi:MAG: hypothetical protein WA814_11850 [Candidatus Baltobacteraceae bacterium]